MKIIYFAWLRTRIGASEETVAPPAGVTDVAGLVEWLKGRGGGYADAFENMKTVRVAVNQEFAGPEDAVGADDEVAFFPPITGGAGGQP